MQKTICVDFDGVIADYSKGYQGKDVFGEVLHGAGSSMSALKEAGWKIIIFTARPDTPALRTYLKENAIPYDEINKNSDQPKGANPGKPIASLYLDDRAMRFHGWADTRYAIDAMVRDNILEAAANDDWQTPKGIFEGTPSDTMAEATTAINSATSFEDIRAAFVRVFPIAGISSGRREYTDAGEKIGGAKKDLWADILAGNRRLESDDMEGMDSATASALVKKDTVLSGIVDTFQENGVEPGAAFIMSKVFASYATKPADTDTARKNYVAAADRVRELFASVKTLDDFKSSVKQLRAEFMGYQLSPEEFEFNALVEGLRKAYQDARAQKWREIIKDPLYHKGTKFLDDKANQALYAWDRENRDTMLPDDVFKKHYALKREWDLREEDNPESRRNQYRSLGDRFINIITGKSKAFDDNYNEAFKVSGWEWLTPTRARKDRTKQEKPKWSRTVPDTVERAGGADAVFKPQDLVDKFKIRGVEYGNYVDEESARHHTQMLGLSFMDMSEILGIPIEHVSYGGRLAIAFGARGTGNASAHYEPGRKVINMTKLRGGGSLAHEWGHFLDNVVHMVSTGGESKSSYVSGAVSGKKTINKQPTVPLGNNTPEVMKEAFEELHQVMMTGTAGAKWSDVKDLPTGSYQLQMIQRMVDPELNRGMGPQQVMDVYRRMTRSRWSPTKRTSVVKPRYTDDELKLLAAYIESKTGKMVYYSEGTSQFYADSSSMTSGEGESYWTRPHEMLARAFEGYMQSKMDERGMKNSYLVGGLDTIGEGAPYPRGEERDHINAAFDKVFAVLKENNILESAMRLDVD